MSLSFVERLIHLLGGTNDCNFKIKYNLLPLCPEELESSDFKLSGQFAQIYVKDHITLTSRANRTLDTTTAIGSSYGTPFGTHPIGPVISGSGTDISQASNWYWPFGPDPVKYPNHTDRHQTNEITNPDNFTDNSLNYPPLVPDISQTLITDLTDENEIVTHTVCAGTSAGATLYLRVNSTNECFDIAAVTLTMLPLPSAIPTELTACDLGEGSADFDLTAAITTLDPMGDNTVTFHETALQAAFGNSAIDTSNPYVSTGQQLQIRVESDNGCFNLTTLTLTVDPCIECPPKNCLDVNLMKNTEE